MAGLEHVVQNAVLQAAQHVEAQLDSELSKLDNLQEEDVDKLRQQRLQELKRMHEKKQEWAARGHGEYKELASEKEFFADIKGEERLVCHFYRESEPCRVIDRHLALLAPKHVETKFVKINAEKSPFLTEKLKVWMLPTLALVQHEKTIDYVVGFDQLGGSDDFPTDTLARRLAHSRMIFYHEDDGFTARKQEPKSDRVRKGISFQKTESDEDSDFD